MWNEQMTQLIQNGGIKYEIVCYVSLWFQWEEDPCILAFDQRWVNLMNDCLSNQNINSNSETNQHINKILSSITWLKYIK